MNRPSRRRRLSLPDTGVFLCSLVLLPSIHIGLHLLGYEGMRRLGAALAPIRPDTHSRRQSMRIERAREIAAVVSIAARRGLFKASCLRRSFLVWWLLRTRGFESTLCFGVRRTGEYLEAHAWVEHDGLVLDDSGDVRKRYRRLAEPPPPSMPGL